MYIKDHKRMSTTITRRDILKLTGGGIIGMMLSPLPWKMLDDAAIWTQNWDLTPKLAHGPIASMFSHCTLCPAGCGVKAQCVSGMPFSITGVPGDPLTHGTVCPRGLTAHHMAYHPLRITHPHYFSDRSAQAAFSAFSLEQSLNRITMHIGSSTGSIVVLDRQPGRILSGQYHKFLSATGRGNLATGPSGDVQTLSSVGTVSGIPSTTLGFDLKNATMLLSFGAPLFDGWGNPGAMNAMRSDRTFKVVQIDPRYSRTARQADQWIAVAPGTEQRAALSIASVLIEENLVKANIRRTIKDFESFTLLVNDFKPEKTAEATGIPAAVIRTLARELAHATAPIVLSGSDPGGGAFDAGTEQSIAALNVLLGTVKKSGGIVERYVLPGLEDIAVTPLNDLPDDSIGTLFIDGADSGHVIPWTLIERKLRSEASLVVSFSSVLDPLTAHADVLIPAPAPFEMLQEAPQTQTSSVPTFSLSAPLLKQNSDTVDPITVLQQLAKRMNLDVAISDNEAALKETVDRLHQQKRGTVTSYADNSTQSVKEIASSDALWNILMTGGIWVGETKKQSALKPVTLSLKGPGAEINGTGPLLLATGCYGSLHAAQLSPVMSKMFQETELRPVNGMVALSPVTAQQHGLTHDGHAELTTSAGSQKVQIKISPAIRPGILEAAIGPSQNGVETPEHPSASSLLQLFPVAPDGTWRTTLVTIQKV